MKMFLALLLASGAVASVDANEEEVPIAERVVERAFVPDAEDPHGEVRLIHRGSLTVMQTILHTKLLRRVVGEIRDKETANWPRSTGGADDALAFVEALDSAQKNVWWRYKQRTPRTERRQSLLIEFVVDEASSYVTLSEPEVEVNGGRLAVKVSRPIARLELSREYVEANMRLIAADAFAIPATEAVRLLRRSPVHARTRVPGPPRGAGS